MLSILSIIFYYFIRTKERKTKIQFVDLKNELKDETNYLITKKFENILLLKITIFAIETNKNYRDKDCFLMINILLCTLTIL